MENLEPRYDARKSFYGKAKVDGLKLYSYGVLVAEIEDDRARVYNHGPSDTTLRHIKEFLKQHGFKADNKNQIYNDYTKEEE